MDNYDFRSSLEVNWHEELEKLGIEHQYETLKVSMKIDGVETTYTPDFVLPAQGLVIEVKGSHPWEGKSMQKTRMLAKMGYSVLKCTGEGKFNFIGNDSSSCFILKCPACSRHFFSCSLDETCPFCSDDTVKDLVYDGSEGISAWRTRKELDRWLFDKEAFDRIHNTLRSESRDAHQNVYEKLCGVPHMLRYTNDMIEKLKSLFQKYPNMNEVERFFFSVIDTLPVRNDQTISFPPILLEGSPGCGKTSFAMELGKIIAEKNHLKIELSNGVVNFTIAGSDRGFNNSETGIILKAMYSDGFSPVKNPLIILDEIDKCQSNTYASESVFHTLLEKRSAKVFTDNFFGIPVDASKVNYIGLCNDSTRISRSIMDRFKHFYIRDYTRKELRDTVIPGIYENWLHDEQVNLARVPRHLSREIREKILKLCNGKPRKIVPLLNDFLRIYLHKDSTTYTFISLFTTRERKNWKSLCYQPSEETACDTEKSLLLDTAWVEEP